MKDIVDASTELPWLKNILTNEFRIQVGNGSTVLFWEDCWCGNQPLRESYSRLYNISTQQHTLIQDMSFSNGSEWIWSLQWRKCLFQWEDDLLNLLLVQIDPLAPNIDAMDEIK